MRDIRLRPIGEDDTAFLLRLYASTRTEELAGVDWSEAQKREFLRMQFDAQHRHYQTHYPNARFDVIEHRGMAAGRLYVDRWPAEIRVIDIALLPEHRNTGIGGVLMHALLDEANRDEKSVSIHVERNNRALRFYERLGLRVTKDEGVYFLLSRAPSVRSEEQPVTGAG